MASAGEEFVARFIKALEARGVGARDVAAAFAGQFGAELPPATENMPGFEYVNRVGSAGVIAISGQYRVLNNAWSEMRKGRYSFGTAVRTWVGMVDSYLGILKEASRLPGRVPTPTWVLFQFDRQEKNTQRQAVRVDRRLAANTQLDQTEFVSLGAANTADGLYFAAPQLLDEEVIVELDRDKLSKVKPGVYTSFVFVKAQGPQTPLVNVVLQVR